LTIAGGGADADGQRHEQRDNPKYAYCSNQRAGRDKRRMIDLGDHRVEVAFEGYLNRRRHFRVGG
jgi:hypothetical protein